MCVCMCVCVCSPGIVPLKEPAAFLRSSAVSVATISAISVSFDPTEVSVCIYHISNISPSSG